MTSCDLVELFNENGKIVIQRIVGCSKSLILKQARSLPSYGVELWNYFEDGGFFCYLTGRKEFFASNTYSKDMSGKNNPMVI